MGAATMAYTLWDKFLKHNPKDPRWADRARFVLSAGHASMLLYSLLYLTGYDITLDDIKNFRQWGSNTPGHPEFGSTPGVEATTGPLGQGFANAVGMAVAERHLAAAYNRPDCEIINHRTFVLASDGDLEEGVSSEAASFAGTHRLGKLICLYDSNNISIEGNTDITFKEDVGQRFRAYGWNVIGPIDGMSAPEVETAIKSGLGQSELPTLIICRTVIGYGSPNKAGTASAHGEPLGSNEVALAKKQLGWEFVEPFTVPPEVVNHLRLTLERAGKQQKEWERKLDEYRKKYPGQASQLLEALQGKLPDGWDKGLEGLFKEQSKPMSTREASGRVMNSIAEKATSLVGGAADLAPSTKTYLAGKGDFTKDDYGGRNIHFGVREHAMGSISNGMALHGGLIPYTGTFLAFYDYMRPPVRLAALMGIRVVFVFTHDSIGLGEDGPTHQPVEQIMGLRTVPGLVTIRPADATETAEAWKIALERETGPTALVLTRQNLPVFDRTELAPASGVRRGAYVLWSSGGNPDIILMATGSEVHLALEAGKKLKENGVPARVVSMPSWELFDAQPEEYRNQVLPPQNRVRLSVEAATTLGWEHYVGFEGLSLGVSRFGTSAPGKTVYEKLGLTADNIVEKAVGLVSRSKRR